MPDLTADQFVVNPMLCQHYRPGKDAITLGMWVEPKLDGIRGLVVVPQSPEGKLETFVYSRTSKPLCNTDLVMEEIRSRPYANYVLDGEFYAENWNLTMSILRSQETHPERDKLRLYAFDVLMLDAWLNGRDNRPQSERRELLEEMFPQPGRVILARKIPAGNAEDVQVAFLQLLLDGYEGAVLKRPEGQYVLGKRSRDWMKIKPWVSIDVRITDAIQGKPGKYQETLGMLMVEGDVDIDGQTAHIKTGVGSFAIDDDERHRLWAMHQKGELVGRIAEIKIQHLTINDAGRHGIFYRLRLDRE